MEITLIMIYMPFIIDHRESIQQKIHKLIHSKTVVLNVPCHTDSCDTKMPQFLPHLFPHASSCSLRRAFSLWQYLKQFMKKITCPISRKLKLATLLELPSSQIRFFVPIIWFLTPPYNILITFYWNLMTNTIFFSQKKRRIGGQTTPKIC